MMLSVEAIEAGYHGAKVLQGVDFDLDEGEALALLGRNGMGKTTTVRALFGLLPLKAGRIVFEGAALNGRPAYAIARTGLGLVPEGRQTFPTLTVEENLVATAATRHGRGRWTLTESSASSHASLSAAAITAINSPAESSKCSLSDAL